GFFHSLHQRRFRVGKRDFRGAFIGRRTRKGLLQDGLTLRLAQLPLPHEDILQKLARSLPRLLFRRKGGRLLFLRLGRAGFLSAFKWAASILRALECSASIL